jgi:hypothetical protein
VNAEQNQNAMRWAGLIIFAIAAAVAGYRGAYDRVGHYLEVVATVTGLGMWLGAKVDKVQTDVKAMRDDTSGR